MHYTLHSNLVKEEQVTEATTTNGNKEGQKGKDGGDIEVQLDDEVVKVVVWEVGEHGVGHIGTTIAVTKATYKTPTKSMFNSSKAHPLKAR